MYLVRLPQILLNVLQNRCTFMAPQTSRLPRWDAGYPHDLDNWQHIEGREWLQTPATWSRNLNMEKFYQTLDV
jgi:hypothetical protein